MLSDARKRNVAERAWLGSPGPSTIDVLGGDESGPAGAAETFHSWTAGVRSMLSYGSVARTSKRCSPLSMYGKRTGLAHSSQCSVTGSTGSGGSPGSGGSGGSGGIVGSSGGSSRHSNCSAVGGRDVVGAAEAEDLHRRAARAVGRVLGDDACRAR